MFSPKKNKSSSNKASSKRKNLKEPTSRAEYFCQDFNKKPGNLQSLWKLQKQACGPAD